MIELIAVNDPFTLIDVEGNQASLDLSHLKRQALMFSDIHISTLDRSILSNKDYVTDQKR
jgi:hypothetical protein